jgi:hypothetical protein
MARASVPTILPIDEVARIAGINPVHFNGAYGGTRAWQGCGLCSDFWYQYAWQSATGFARENLARNVAEAELELEGLLGAPLVPTLKKKKFDFVSGRPLNFTWLSGQRMCIPDACNPDRKAYYVGHRLLGYTPKTWTQLGITSDAGFSIDYSDEDGDEFAELGTISFSLADEVEPSDLGLFYVGKFGVETERIRPVKYTTITFNDDTDLWDYVIAVDSWQLIDPAHWEAPPREPATDGSSPGNTVQCSMRALDITAADAFVSDLVVGRLVADPSYPMVRFFYPNTARCGDPTCSICSMRVVNGCYAEMNHAQGFVTPVPATYTEEDGWCPIAPTTCCAARPATVEISYYDGLEDSRVDDRFGPVYNQALQQIVMLLAISRSQLGQCDCSCNAGQAWKKLSEDLTETKGAGRYLSFDVINNKFGLSRGEIMAYQRYSLYTLNKLIVTAGASK